MNTSSGGDDGSGMESDDCLISYSIIETVHAAVYIFIAVSNLSLSPFPVIRNSKNCSTDGELHSLYLLDVSKKKSPDR